MLITVDAKCEKKGAPTVSVEEIPGVYIVKRIINAPKSVSVDLVTLEIVPEHPKNAKTKFVMASLGRRRIQKGQWIHISKVRFGECVAYILR